MNNYTIIDFEEDIRLCIKQLKELGYREIEKNSYELSFNSRLIKTLGRCIRLKKKDFLKIELGIQYVNKASREMILGIIMHEVIHSLPKAFDHQQRWKSIANHVNATYGYNIQRCLSESSYNELLEDKVKYIITCDSCKAEFRRIKKGNFVKAVETNNKRYRCSCGSEDFSMKICR